MEYTKELNRYLKDNKNKFSEDVIDYGKSFVNRIKSNNIIKEYFKANNIGIYSFLSELLPMSENKLKIINNYQLNENEINQIFGKIILNNEILLLLLNDKILINGLNIYGELVYELTDSAIEYFQLKYGIKMNKLFSLRDILILNINNDDENDEDDNNNNLLY